MAAALSWPNKDPDEVLDYEIDWTARLGTSENILTSLWELDPTDPLLTTTTNSHANKTTTIWLSGGTEGAKSVIENTITTDGARTMAQSVNIKVKSR